jgi:hypothetical protein
MSQRSVTTNSRCPSFIPPYLLTRIASDDDAARAAPAVRTMALDEVHRARRQATGATPTDPPPGAAPNPRRTIYSAHNDTDLPGDEVRAEGAPSTGDPATDEAYDGLGQTWSLYYDVYGRDSIDGAGLPLLASVHYGDRYDNAFWDGEQMVFGDGDGVTFNRFTIAVDVMGHELTHGVTQLTAGLEYHDQPGALNESVSDVFGSLVKQRSLGQDAASADWLIGQGLFTQAVHGAALRSMKAPGTAYDDPVLGKDPQPATMADYVHTTGDNGGVHINSGIPNHAFYLAATAIGGNAWEGAGRIWFDTLTGGAVSAQADFAAFAAVTHDAAGARFGPGSAQQLAIRNAWQEVGVSVTGVDAAAPGTAPPAPAATSAGLVVERSGGFAGLQLARQVDLGALPDDDASAWHELLGSALLRELPAEQPQPDRYVYRIVHAGEGIDAVATEQQLPDSVRDLIERTLRER